MTSHTLGRVLGLGNLINIHYLKGALKYICHIVPVKLLLTAGIVSFADTGVQDTQLITSVATLKTAVDTLSSGGSTNHEDAFEKALALFNPASTNAKVMVMFTDGVTTAGGNANAIATLAKAQGVIIYVIGLSGNGGIDEQALVNGCYSILSA